jgi:hypothetical protein
VYALRQKTPGSKDPAYGVMVLGENLNVDEN